MTDEPIEYGLVYKSRILETLLNQLGTSLICPALHMMLVTLAGRIQICNSFQSFHKFLVEQLLVMHTDVLVSTS